jgi:hypothetical protein
VTNLGTIPMSVRAPVATGPNRTVLLGRNRLTR